MKNFINTISLKASFTVEAAIIVPLILFTIIGGINIGYDMFTQSKAAIEIHEEIKDFNPVKIVRQNSFL